MREELKDVRDRVRSMALVHEKLYQTSDLAQLNFGDYATSLLHSLWRSHGALADKVRLHLAVAPVALPIEAAVPCGLLLNELAGNALKHAFPGNSGGEVTVTLEHDAATGTVSLQVRDNGVGLPAGMDWRQSTIARPASCANSHQSVARYAGNGQRSRYNFPGQLFPERGSSMNKRKILIAEDEGIVAEDLANKVRQLGYDVVGPTATGEEAVELAKSHQPALVLMDIRLAGAMDGITAARQIRLQCDLPILFLTAHSDAGTVERAQQAGALGYVLKPFDDRDLRIQIEMALYKHSAERQLRVSEARLAAINRILQAALTCQTEEDLGKICLAVAEEITQSKFGFLGDINQDGLTDIAISKSGWEACNISSDPSGHGRPLAGLKIHGIYGRVILDGKSLFTNDPASHPDSIGVPENHPPLTSFLGVPLMSEGKVIGLLAVGNRQGGYSPVDQETLEMLTPSIVQAFKRKRAEDALQTLNADLEKRVEQRTLELQETQQQYLHAEKLSAIGRLSASIAHEFNNPLQGIMAVLKGLRKRAILEDEDRELLEAAIDESSRMKKLILSLQEFNRPSSCHKVLMDMQTSIDSLLLLYKSEFKNKRIAVQQNYAKRLPQIMAIPDQIKQVFLNLLNNAADACQPSGGIITISTRQDNDRIAISIKDSGIGIQPEHVDLIFQPFYTTKPEVKGTGLGLSVCHGIVKNHQGEIRVESLPGQGATFTVLLPVQGE